MKTKMHRILVAVESTERMPLSLLYKAAFLANASGARVELFHVIADLRPEPPSPLMSRAEVEASKAEVAAARLRRLEHFGRCRRLAGLNVEVTVAWDSSAYKAIVRRALASRADLVIAGTHRHTIGARLVSESIDWELIRQCPVPLLIVKTRRSYQDAPVVAAVDPWHANTTTANLDLELLRLGRRWARWCNGDLHLFHAYMPLIPVQTLPMALAAPLVTMPPDLEPMHQHQVEATIARLAETARIPKQRRHLQLGHVAPELRGLATRLGAGVVAMGAVSRSRIERLLIGSTAERVLDDVPCDVLVLKPSGFKTRIALRGTTLPVRLRREDSRVRAPA